MEADLSTSLRSAQDDRSLGEGILLRSLSAMVAFCYIKCETPFRRIPMHDMVNVMTCLTALMAVFVLGWRLGHHRRSRLNEIAALAAKQGYPKVQGGNPTPKPAFFQLNLAKQGVIELHDSWRQKWHGQH
jgi:hypothetical protein